MYQTGLRLYLSRECRKLETLFRKLTSATCRAPHTTPSIVSGLSAWKVRAHRTVTSPLAQTVLDTPLKNQQSQS